MSVWFLLLRPYVVSAPPGSLCKRLNLCLVPSVKVAVSTWYPLEEPRFLPGSPCLSHDLRLVPSVRAMICAWFPQKEPRFLSGSLCKSHGFYLVPSQGALVSSLAWAGSHLKRPCSLAPPAWFSPT